MRADSASVARRIADVAGDSARIEARWLTEAAAGDGVKLEALVLRRLAGEPVDRVIGSRGFWTLDLKVTPDVLSPRSDTETVVRAVLEVIQARDAKSQPLRLLDLGTGSGAILLALLNELPEATGLGVDVSNAALSVACENAEWNGLQARAAFQLGDWAADLGGMFDVIVSNPPYIPAADIAGLDREVRDFDPHLALDGGADGLDPYRLILSQVPSRLAPGGFVALEFGQGQGHSIADLALKNGFNSSRLYADLNGILRACILN